MIKGIIFDIDGVLLNSLSIWDNLGAKYLRSIGTEPEKGLNEILFSMSMEQAADYMVERYNLSQSSEDVINGISQMIESFYFNEAPAKIGAKELMEYMKDKGIKMTAATSCPRIHVEKALERNGMLKYLDKIFTNGEIGVSKHSPDIYNIAAEYMGTEPKETFVFEDSIYALNTAREAGFITVGVYAENGEPDQDGVRNAGEYYLKSMSEFAEVLESELSVA